MILNDLKIDIFVVKSNVLDSYPNRSVVIMWLEPSLVTLFQMEGFLALFTLLVCIMIVTVFNLVLMKILVIIFINFDRSMNLLSILMID